MVGSKRKASRPGVVGPFAVVVNSRLFGQCLEAIDALFCELEIKAPPTTLGEEAALIYQDVVASQLKSPEDQLTAIRVLIAQRRQALLASSSNERQAPTKADPPP